LALFPLLLMAQTGAETNDPAIRAGMDRWMVAWNHHDANAFAAVFSEDADFANRRGTGARVAVRRSKIEEFHAPVLATICSKSHQEYIEIKTRFIPPDLAAVDGGWRMAGAIDAPANPRPQREGLLSFVAAKSAGPWEVAVVHNQGHLCPAATTEMREGLLAREGLCQWGILRPHGA
jgi:uncharacterized protein (TIGR02246 family)